VDEIITIGLDVAKGVFHAVGRDAAGVKLFSRQLRRGQVEGFFARHAPCVVVMEACGSAHDWGRRLEALGCRVKLIAPIYVKPYVVRNKNDARDADGLSQAGQRPDMRTVAVKSAEQQARASLHRVRDLMIRQRTQIMNQIRGIAAEFGLTTRVGRPGLKDLLAQAQAAELPGPARLAIDLQARHLGELDAEVAELTAQIARQARASPDARRLMTIPAVGEVVADAFLARLPDLATFKTGRDLAAWLGLTRLDKSTGGKARTSGPISKKGDKALRRLLVLGATAVIARQQRDKRLDPWIAGIIKKRCFRVAAVALAAKTARIIWAILAHGGTYQSGHRPTLATA
jgi:transposase